MEFGGIRSTGLAVAHIGRFGKATVGEPSGEKKTGRRSAPFEHTERADQLLVASSSLSAATITPATTAAAAIRAMIRLPPASFSPSTLAPVRAEATAARSSKRRRQQRSQLYGNSSGHSLI
jgi:hypothetical protein